MQDLLTLQPAWSRPCGILHPSLHCDCCTMGRCLDKWVGTGPLLAGVNGWMDSCLQVGAGVLAVWATQSITLGLHTAGEVVPMLATNEARYIQQPFVDGILPFCAQIWLKWSRNGLIQVRAPKATVCLWTHNPLHPPKNPNITSNKAADASLQPLLRTHVATIKCKHWCLSTDLNDQTTVQLLSLSDLWWGWAL